MAFVDVEAGSQLATQTRTNDLFRERHFLKTIAL